MAIKRPVHFFFLSLAALLACHCGARACTQLPVTYTSNGVVVGYLEKVRLDGGAEVSVPAYRGIPYAQADRWESPESIFWYTPLLTQSYGPNCAQSGLTYVYTGVEACHYMNIWGSSGGEKRPVIVWIHGGGFELGGAGGALYDGAYMAAREDVVVVSFNYRLGVLGTINAKLWNGTHVRGNFALEDQIFALQWIQDNIAHFGGDPDNVTLMGESAGAQSVGLHLLSIPESENLFQAAIMQSNFLAPLHTKSQAALIGERFVQNTVWCHYWPTPRQCMADLPLDIVLFAQGAYGTRLNPQKAGYWEMVSQAGFFRGAAELWAPYVDGKIVKRQPVDGVIQKPAIFGLNRNDGRYLVQYYNKILKAGTDAQFIERFLVPSFGAEHTARILAWPEYNLAAFGIDTVWERINRHAFFACPMRKLTVGAGTAPYLYRMEYQPLIDWLSPLYWYWTGVSHICRPDDVVCHGADQPFTFHYKGYLSGTEEFELSDRQIDYYGNLARNKTPGTVNLYGEPLPPWNAAVAPDYQMHQYRPAAGSLNDPYKDVCAAVWDHVGYE